jgi:hypothetical protein
MPRHPIAVLAVSRGATLGFHENHSYGYAFRSKPARGLLRIPQSRAIPHE